MKFLVHANDFGKTAYADSSVAKNADAYISTKKLYHIVQTYNISNRQTISRFGYNVDIARSLSLACMKLKKKKHSPKKLCDENTVKYVSFFLAYFLHVIMNDIRSAIFPFFPLHMNRVCMCMY